MLRNFTVDSFRLFFKLVGDAVCVGGKGKEWMGCLLDDLGAFDIKADQMWMTTA